MLGGMKDMCDGADREYVELNNEIKKHLEVIKALVQLDKENQRDNKIFKKYQKWFIELGICDKSGNLTENYS
jgi:hypothetical protein